MSHREKSRMPSARPVACRRGTFRRTEPFGLKKLQQQSPQGALNCDPAVRRPPIGTLLEVGSKNSLLTGRNLGQDKAVGESQVMIRTAWFSAVSALLLILETSAET